jgi:signal transduction histidine kinase
VTRRRWLLVTGAVIGLAWVIGAEWVSIHAGIQENHFLDALVGLSFIGAGLVAIDRRPGNIIGPLMVAFGAIQYVGNWSNLGLPVFPTLWVISQTIPAAFIAHIALAYPDGRVRRRFDRFVLWTIYVSLVATAALAVLTYPRRIPGCDCPWTPIFVPNRQISLFMYDLNHHLAIVLVPLFLVAIVLRFRRASLAERRALLPLWVGVGLLALVFLIGAIAGDGSDTDPFQYLLWELRALLELPIPLVFLWGLLSERLARSAVGDLVIDLDRPLSPEELRTTMARALHDPTLEIAYAIDRGSRWVDGEGRTVRPPMAGGAAHGDDGISVVEREGEILAALVHDPALEPGLVQAAGVAAGMAIANERLRAEVRAQLEEVRASRLRIVEAGDAARKRVERDLHDGAQQRLVGLSLGLRLLETRLDGVDGAGEEIEALQSELRAALQELRELARGLHPQILTEEGLGAAIEALAERFPLPVRVRVEELERPPAPVEATAYFVVAEALQNVSKYAQASSASVAVSRENGALTVEVSDDGVGGAALGGGSGLLGLVDRVAALGGSLVVESPSGRGTHLHAEIPWAPR